MCQNESSWVRYQYQLVQDELLNVAEERGDI